MQKAFTSRFALSILIAAAVAVCALLLVGCSSTPAIGEKSNDAVKVAVKNDTGQAITSVAVKSTLDQEFSEALSQDSDWSSGTSVDLYLDPEVIEVASESIEEGEDATVAETDDIVIEPLTDIQLTTADGMTYVLHQLNVEDIKDATIELDGETAYLVYTSISTGEEVNTLEAELAYQEQIKAAEAQAKAEAEAAAKAAEEQAQKEKEQQNKKNNNKTTSGSKKPSSSSNPSSSASSGEDECVDDLVGKDGQLVK